MVFGPLVFSPENGGGPRHPWPPPLDPRLLLMAIYIRNKRPLGLTAPLSNTTLPMIHSPMNTQWPWLDLSKSPKVKCHGVNWNTIYEYYICILYMNTIYEYYIWILYMNTIYEYYIWILYMNTIYEYYIWILYMNTIYEYYIWILYMNTIYEYYIWILYMNTIYEYYIWILYMNTIYVFRTTFNKMLHFRRYSLLKVMWPWFDLERLSKAK